MSRLRAVPSRGWLAVVALVALASLGVTAVLGAGLQVWRGTISAAPGRIAGIDDLRPHPRPVITVPVHPRGAPHHAGQGAAPAPAAPLVHRTATSKPAAPRIKRVHPPTPVLKPTLPTQANDNARQTGLAARSWALRHRTAVALHAAKHALLTSTAVPRAVGLRSISTRVIASRRAALATLPAYRVTTALRAQHRAVAPVADMPSAWGGALAAFHAAVAAAPPTSDADTNS